ncbi:MULTISPECIES: hypothetical protein [Pseudomonas]|uniref:hypothetical protein n=1 Tax=Pseudomonas TaxID=286 RepID=UPI000F04D44C|nr:MULTISPECIES: hypothetical protein [Pseudomonas]UVL24080.1 hypothetical protein LOY30_25295 [Pseudomonas donghuensis]
MSKPFDMELFLAAVLTGSYATRQRHLRQAKLIQAEISERWQLETPWGWKKKHVAWFFDHRLARRCEATRYYYLLTVRLLVRRLERTWVFKSSAKV